MEETKSFEDLAREEGNEPVLWEPSEEFTRDFCAYMEESIRQSRENEALAIKSASEIFIH